MQSRERLLTTLRGGQADRVPVNTYDLIARNSRQWEHGEPSYARLLEIVRGKTDCICKWNPRPNTTFLESANPVDMEIEQTREGDATIYRRTLHTPRGDLTQTTKVIDNIHTVWQTEHWCKNLDDVEKALSVPYEPVVWDAGDYPRIKAEVGEHGIIMTTLSDPLWLAADLMEFGEYTIWAMTETEHFLKVVEQMHERVMENLRRMLDTVVVDDYRICGPEYATPPYLPPPLFRKFVVPYVREMVDLIHSRGALARFHCHGRVGQVLDMIAETGADSLDPCEAPPDGDITLAEIKKRIGGRMCILGNIQIKLLEHGHPQEVEQSVKDCMTAAKAGGGYILLPTAGPISAPLSGQTEENFIHFIEAGLKYGIY